MEAGYKAVFSVVDEAVKAEKRDEDDSENQVFPVLQQTAQILRV